LVKVEKMKLEIEISQKLKDKIDSITDKPLKEFCEFAIIETAQAIQDDLMLSCA